MLKFRLIALATLVAVVGLVLTLTALNRRQPRVATLAAAPPSAAATAPVLAAVQAEPVEPAAAARTSPISSSGVRDYSVLPDGRPVPELPATAPKSCGFGAILFTFDGVQLAPRHPRTKSEAYDLAKRLIPEAEANFAEAVKKGDPGSLADAGTISRGVLERSVEYQLFTLDKGTVHPEPIETPRGYWILRRTR